MNPLTKFIKIDVELGYLVIYHTTTLQFPMGDGKLYFQDKRCAGIEFGPFLSINDCVIAWQKMVPQPASAIPAPLSAKESFYLEGYLPDHDIMSNEPQTCEVPNNIINVDFKLKKRIP